MKSRLALAVACAAVVLGPAVGAVHAAEPYKIGFLHSFAGYAANNGVGARDGFLLAVDVINKRGGVNGRPLQVLMENDESDPSKGVPLGIRLIEAEKVIAIVGPVRSDITEALGPIAQKAQVVNMTDSFLLPTRGTFTFSTVPSPEEEARIALDFIKAKGAKTIAILSSLDLYNKTSAKAFADAAAQRGIKVVATESYNAAVDTNFIPQLTKMKAANPDWLTICGSGPVPVILNQKADIGFSAPVLGNLASAAMGVPAMVKIAGKNLEGAHFTTLPVAVWKTLPKGDPRIPRITDFRNAFKAKYGTEPVMANWWIAQNYDEAFLLAEALKKAGAGATGASLKTALESIKDFHGVVGTFSFAADHHAGATGIVIGVIKGGQIVHAQ